jgi:hypothetical protein
METIKEIMTLVGELDTHRVKLAIILTNVLNAPGIPESTETLAVKMATIAALMDFIEEAEGMDHAKPLMAHIEQAIDTCLKNAGGFVPESVMREALNEMRKQARESRARIKEGDSILGGIDFSDN